MKPNFSLFDFPKMVLGFFFASINLFCRRKTRRNFQVYGKRENAYFHSETATGKREKWRENNGRVVTFAVRVSCKRDVKSLCCQQVSMSYFIFSCSPTRGTGFRSLLQRDKDTSMGFKKTIRNTKRLPYSCLFNRFYLV